MFHVIFMYIFGAISVASALSVVLLSKIVYSIVMVLVFFISIAAILIGMYAEYLALITLMVYAGAIMVLYLFAMIMFRQDTSRVIKGITSVSIPLILVIAIILTIIWGTMITGVIRVDDINNIAAANALTVANFSESLFGVLLIPFEIVSVLLLLAMMGAILISNRMEKKMPPRNKSGTKSGAKAGAKSGVPIMNQTVIDLRDKPINTTTGLGSGNISGKIVE